MDNTSIFSRDKTLRITIPYRSFNAQTPLIFNGKKSINYGRDINQNFLNLLSNFANDIPDVRMLDGQLWFDSKNDKLMLKDDNIFREVGYTRPPLVPSEAIRDYDLRVLLLDLLSVNGGTISGTLLTKTVEDVDSENSVINKQFVDGFIPPIPKIYIPISGNTSIPSGKIYAPPMIPENPLQIVNKKYVDDNTPQLKTISEDGKISIQGSETLKGYANVIEYSPYNLVYIFGEAYIPIDNITTDVYFDIVGNLKSSQLQLSIINNSNKDITVDGKFTVKDNKGQLTIIRHNTINPEAITVHFIITGIKA